MASKRGLAARGSAQSSGEPGYSAGAEPPWAAAGLRRLRPPREPRRVFFFGFGCSPSPSPFWDGVSAASGSSSRPSVGSGRWIFGPSPFSALGCSGGASPFAWPAVAGFFLRRRPPREPRLVGGGLVLLGDRLDLAGLGCLLGSLCLLGLPFLDWLDCLVLGLLLHRR